MNIVLIYFAIKYKGNWDDIYKALEAKEAIEHKELIALEEEMKKSEYRVVTVIDPDYPDKLKDAYKPPFVLWTKGDYTLLKNKVLCISGNEVDDIAEERIKKFTPEVLKNHTLVIPSFKGVDVRVAEHSNKVGRIFVLANGLDKPYLNNETNDKDLLITEYPPTSHVSKERFRNRNRIIASLSQSLILFTSEKDGGINNAVINFLNLGKDIYCFPGDGGPKDGNSELIKQGASLITSIKDINC